MCPRRLNANPLPPTAIWVVQAWWLCSYDASDLAAPSQSTTPAEGTSRYLSLPVVMHDLPQSPPRSPLLDAAQRSLSLLLISG